MLHICPAFLPVLAASQIHRKNIPADSYENYYQRLFLMPLVDNLKPELKSCFNLFMLNMILVAG